MIGFSNIRMATRAILRQPGIAAVAVIALGLGIGLPAAMYSLTNGLAFRGLPVDEGDRIVHLERRPHDRRGEGWGTAPKDLAMWRAQQRSFEALVPFTTTTVALRIDSGAERVSAGILGASAFDVLRVRPAIGRAFQPGEDEPGAEPVVIIGNRLWRDRFGSDPGVLGRIVFVDGRAHTVIGVMEEGFRFPHNHDLWTPYVLPADAETADNPTFSVFARLNPGVSIGDARADMRVIAGRVEERFPETNENMGVTVKMFTVHYIGETPIATMRVMMGAVLLVLLIACTNVANLLLVRAVHRVREMAVRAALGASRARIAGQMLLESSILAVFGGAAGIAVASAATGALRRWLGDSRMPYWADMRLDNRTLVFVLGLTFSAALLAGLLPAIKAMGASVIDVIKDQSRGASGFRIGRVMQALIVVEIAISLGLLVNTGLMTRSLQNVRNVRFGFPVERTITAHVTLPETYDDAARRAFLTGLESGVAANPATDHVAIASSVPASRAGTTRFAIEGRSYDEDSSLPGSRLVSASTDFFAAFGASAIAGRTFGPQDTQDGEQVAIVNQRAVDRFFDGRDPIGSRIRIGGLDTTDEWRTIVGVVPDLWAGGLDASGDRNPAAIYTPIAQTPPLDVIIAADMRTDGGAAANAIRAAVAMLDPDVPVWDVKTMDEVIVDNSWFYAFGVGVVGTCGLAALLLAAVGLYGVIAFSVGRRIREFGIRMAIGASPASIKVLVLRRGSIQLVIGMAVGFTIAYVIAIGISSLLFMVSPSDPVTFIAVGLILLAITQLATFIPAVRAARIDPLSALRAE